ncbi:MAG: peptidase U34 [Myxococcota bacterium]|nr:peptidase U34 [Myxococcota bacterium]
MCDTAVRVLPDRVLFAKNSDRDPNEGQLLEWQPRRSHSAGSRLRCTWVEIEQARETHAVLLSRPYWMWGAEMGANEHGVVIGNEAVFTKEPLAETGLTGMDLLRLALERGDSAESAVSVILEWIERAGQGGGCGHEDRSFTYHSSFLVADGREAFVLETAGQKHALERVGEGGRSISNGLSIQPFARQHGDALRTWGAGAASRRACSGRRAREATGAGDLFALLRDHGPGHAAPRYSWLNGAMSAPCVHAGGRVAASQTTGSFVAELAPGRARLWATATAAPCTSLFKPVSVAEPLDLGREPGEQDDGASLWWRHERLHRTVMRDPDRLLPLFSGERDALEARWLADPPAAAEAFAEADRQLARWTARVERAAHAARDIRPAHVRRYWEKRDARARIPA